MAKGKHPKLLHTTATQSGEEVVKSSGLIRRGVRWGFRRRVPDTVRSHIGKREFLKSFGDVPLKEARRLAAREWARTDDLIATAERQIANRRSIDELSVSEIGAIARSYFAALEKQAMLEPPIFNDDQLNAEMELNNEELVGLANGPEDASVQKIATVAAREANVAAAPGTRHFFVLSEAVHAALIEHHRRQSDRLRRRPVNCYDHAFSDAALKAHKPDDGPLMLEMVERWAVKETPPTLKTSDKARQVVKEFLAVVGDRYLRAVTASDVHKYKEHLLEECRSTATAQNKLNLLRAVIRYGREMRVISIDPCDGISIKTKGRAKTKRREYKPEELKAIFGSAVYTDNLRPVGGAGEAAYWLPLLALFTGGRLEELGQLRSEDIAKEFYGDAQGHECEAWTIRIVEDLKDGLRVKNAGSERRIPVHKALIDAGFIKYVSAAKAEGRKQLFPRLTPNKYGVRTANWSKWWGRYVREKLEIVDRSVTFHSFRHTFKDQARNSNVPDKVNDELTGHDTGGVASAYGGFEYPLKPLVEGIALYRVYGFHLPSKP